MNRRGFLKLASAFGAAALVPLPVLAQPNRVTRQAMVLDNNWERYFQLTKPEHAERRPLSPPRLVRFEDLKENDIFCLLEADGQLVDGGDVCVALSDSYVDPKSNTWTVRCGAPIGKVGPSIVLMSWAHFQPELVRLSPSGVRRTVSAHFEDPGPAMGPLP